MNLNNTYILRNKVVSPTEEAVNQNIKAYRDTGSLELTTEYADGIVKQVSMKGDQFVIVFHHHH
jgi:mannose-6-phosphate isomerase-like protein (cupin superfamily)